MKRYAPVSFPQHSTNKPLSPEPNPHLSPIFPPAPVIRNKPHDPGTPNERPLHPARPHTRIALAVCPVSRLCHHPPPDPSGKPHLAPSTVLPLCFRLAPVLKSATIVRSLLFPVLSSFSCIHPELVFFRSGLFVRLRWGGVMNFSDGSDKGLASLFFLFLQLRLHGANLFLSVPIVPTVPISARRFPILFDGCLLPRSTGFSLHVSWAIHQRI